MDFRECRGLCQQWIMQLRIVDFGLRIEKKNKESSYREDNASWKDPHPNPLSEGEGIAMRGPQS
ncbi:MAG TPA: hypothetical protein PLZ55_07595, partial [bacterium]|nr:hypothetical protein [bacterium]